MDPRIRYGAGTRPFGGGNILLAMLIIACIFFALYFLATVWKNID